MNIAGRRKLNGRFVVESDAGDMFEYQLVIRRRSQGLRLVGPPHWRTGPWPSNAQAIASRARKMAIAMARDAGLAV